VFLSNRVVGLEFFPSDRWVNLPSRGPFTAMFYPLSHLIAFYGRTFGIRENKMRLGSYWIPITRRAFSDVRAFLQLVVMSLLVIFLPGEDGHFKAFCQNGSPLAALAFFMFAPFYG